MGKRPFIIGIGGATSSCGKTSVAVALLKALTSGAPLATERDGTFEARESSAAHPLPADSYPSHVTHHPLLLTLKRWGAIKYTKTFLYASVTDDHRILGEEGKDTARLLKAGAEDVLWVRSSPSDIAEVLPMATERLSHLDGIIVEGNSAIEFLSPDIIIFITGSTQKGAKPSARPVLRKAHILVVPGDTRAPSDAALRNTAAGSLVRQAPVVLRTGPLQEGLDERFAQELIMAIDGMLQPDRIEQLLRERSADGRITCQSARQIAEELSVPYSEVGKTANALNIKIRACELGCF